MHSRRRSYRSLASEYMAPRMWDVLFQRNIHLRVDMAWALATGDYNAWAIVGMKAELRDNILRMRHIRVHHAQV